MNRRIVLTTVGLTAAGLLAAGCGGGGGGTSDKPGSSAQSKSGGTGGTSGTSGTSGTPTKAAPVTIVTVAQANAILDHYEQVNNAANKTQDAAKLGTVEGGSLLQVDQQVFKQFRTFTAKYRAEYEEPFHYTKRKFYLPATGSWFMVSAYTGNVDQLMVFKRSGATWKMVSANNYHGALPAVATSAGGAVTVVDPTATVGGTKLSGLSAAITDLMVTGGTKAGSELADSAVRRDDVKAYKTRDDHWKNYKGCLLTQNQAPEPKYDSPYTKFPDTYAVKTADGGALVASTSYYAVGDFSNRPDTCSFTLSGAASVYVKGGDQISLRSRYARLNVVSVPAAGKPVQLGGVNVLIGATN